MGRMGGTADLRHVVGGRLSQPEAPWAWRRSESAGRGRALGSGAQAGWQIPIIETIEPACLHGKVGSDDEYERSY